MSGEVCFVDTSAWAAVADKRDEAHEKGSRFFYRLRDSATLLLTSQFIFSESMILIRRRVSIDSAIVWGETIRASGQVQVVDTPLDIHRRAWFIFKKYKGWELSYVDCLSFATMEKLRIKKVFAFDQDFANYGFEVVPGLS